MGTETATTRFAEFIAKAIQLKRPTSSESSLLQFAAFVKEAFKLAAQPPTASKFQQFSAFVDRATPIALIGIKQKLKILEPRCQMLAGWLTSHDLLRIAGFTYVENSYTELLAWALRPGTHAPSATERSNAWLAALRLEDLCPQNSCEVKTQFRTDDGIPDLVLGYEKAIVVVEVKTGSREHALRAGPMQTVGYKAAVRNKLGLVPDHRIEIVYLTPDRHVAASPDAKLVTFVDVVVALASALSHMQVDADTAAAYRLVFTHLLDATANTNTLASELINRITIFSNHPARNDDAYLVRHVKLIQEGWEIFNSEATDE